MQDLPFAEQVSLRRSGRIVNWWDMQRIAGDYLFHASAVIRSLRCLWQNLRPAGDAAFSAGPVVLTTKQREEACNHLAFVRSCLNGAELAISVVAVDEFCVWLRAPIPQWVSNDDAIARLDELDRTVRRELKSIPLLFLSAREAELYEKPMKGWEEAVSRWSSIKTDVEEASRSFALERYAAAIFHSLLVAEFGVIRVAELFAVAGDKPGWGCVERLQRILDKKYEDRSVVEKQHSKFLQDTMSLIAAVKDWRHKIAHVDNRLIWLDTEWSCPRAEEIMVATRGLMRHLAQQLPNGGKQWQTAAKQRRKRLKP